MNTYQLKFQGRTLGAIGLFSKMCVHVKANNEHDAVMSLYREYDVVMFPVVKLMNQADIEAWESFKEEWCEVDSFPDGENEDNRFDD